MKGVSICIVSYNSFFYNRLAIDQIRKMTRLVNYEILVYDNGSSDGSVEWMAQQPEVILFRGRNNELKHGRALDFLTRRASYPICCCLCVDAFPVSPEWLIPATYLDDDTYLAGIHRNNAATKLEPYVCPSYLFSWTEWLKRHSFVDDWPNWDTGENLGNDCLREGHKIKSWLPTLVDFDGFTSQQCDYNGWVWHTGFTVRRQIVPLQNLECEGDYNKHVENLLRERFNLDY